MSQAATQAIRLYTTNPSHSRDIQTASDAKGYQLELHAKLDPAELLQNYTQFSVLIFDLTGASFSADAVMSAMDGLDGDKAPPVLYLLASPADIAVVAGAGSIANQDYTFVPLDTANLGQRLEVLMMLGARRRLTMESAITDRMTGLHNRKYFLRRLEEELYRCARYGYSLGVVLLDVDFKAQDGKELTEDTGTKVVQQIAEFFKGRLRRSDIIARFKWSDFAMLLPELERDDLDAVAKDMRRKIEEMKVNVGGRDIQLHLAVGELCFPTEGVSTALDVVDALEECVAQARRNGGIAAYLPGDKT
ncbi:diguanylate cyclase [bacterium]|nr:diguanylate cyclase [bacterium]